MCSFSPLGCQLRAEVICPNSSNFGGQWRLGLSLRLHRLDSEHAKMRPELNAEQIWPWERKPAPTACSASCSGAPCLLQCTFFLHTTHRSFGPSPRTVCPCLSSLCPVGGWGSFYLHKLKRLKWFFLFSPFLLPKFFSYFLDHLMPATLLTCFHFDLFYFSLLLVLILLVRGIFTEWMCFVNQEFLFW